VTADDFGLHVAVNEAVEQACRNGLLSAASLMVAGPAAADAIHRARGLANLRVGLHLVLADGRAALAPELIPSLADRHGHMDDRMFARGVKFFAVPQVRRQLEAEIRAEFAAFARTGFELDHVNVHKHFHMHPTILTMIIRIGREYGATAVRLPDEPLWFSSRMGQRSSSIQAGLLKPWVMLMRHRLAAARLFHNDQLFGIACSGAMDESKLLAILARLPTGVTEIYLHPATLSGEAVAQSMRGYGHAAELAALLSPRVLAAAAGLGVRRGGYQDARRIA
jgi:hopanoid biosynthesis associated protein HpnK